MNFNQDDWFVPRHSNSKGSQHPETRRVSTLGHEHSLERVAIASHETNANTNEIN